MGSSMMLDIQKKYNQLTQTQKDMFAGYGLRQIKHFVEISLPKIEQLLPVGAEVQGINAEGKVQAYDAKTDQYYVWISDLQWQKSNRATLTVDLKTDAIAIWQLFELANHELVDLSHVHRDYLASLEQV
jgi:outer membrane protease